MDRLAMSPRVCSYMLTILALMTVASQATPLPMFKPGLYEGGRSLRQLPCKSRRTDEIGVCMFAMECMKANGTHLGTCIDRFYFGACCQLDIPNHLDPIPLGPSPTPTPTPFPPLVTFQTILDDNNANTIGGVLLTKPPPPPTTTTTTTTAATPALTNRPPASTPIGAPQTTPKTTPKTTTTTTTTAKPTKVPPTTAKPVTTTKKPSVVTRPKPIESTTKTTTTAPPKTTKPTTTKPTTTKKPVTKPKPSATTTKRPTTPKPTTTITTTTNKQKPTTTTKKPTPTTTTTLPPSLITWTSLEETIPTTKRPVITTTTTKKPFTTKKPSSTVTTTTKKPQFVTITTTAQTTKKPAAASTTTTTKKPSTSVTTKKPSSPSTKAPSTTSSTTPVKTTTATKKPTTTESWVQISVSTPSTTEETLSSENVTSSTPKSPTSTASSSLTTASTTTSGKPITTESISTSSNGTTTETTTTSTWTDPDPLNMTNYKEVCGRRLFPESRIVGGSSSTFGKWPWQISLRQWRPQSNTYLHKCGAALLSEYWAITAAHCVENVPPSDLLLRIGEHDLSSEEEAYGYQERRVQIVASHPQFDARTFEYDLALLRFYEPVAFQPNILPICVPDDDTDFVGREAYVTGWGRLYEEGPLPSVLQEVTVPVINNSRCEKMYRSAGYIEHIPNIFICAGWAKGGKDSCEGDSGGPMSIQRPDKRWMLAGVISWGIGCAEPNQPGVYTRISHFREWINQILQF